MNTAQETINKALKTIKQDPAYKANIGKINRLTLIMDKVNRALNCPMTESNINLISGDLCEVLDLLKIENNCSSFPRF